MSPILTTGDDVLLTVTLYDNGAAMNVSAGSIRAAFQDSRGNLLTEIVTQSSGTSGASWATGAVVIFLTAAQASGLQRGDAYLEIEYTASSVKRTFPLIHCTVQAGSMA